MSTVTDEVTPDRTPGAFQKIFETATAEGITTFEVRMVETKRFPLVDSDAWDRLKKKSAEFGIRFSAVSPGLFKAGLHSDLIALHSKEGLTMSLNLAERLNVSTLIIFGVQRSEQDFESDFDAVVNTIGGAVDVAAARGFDVQLENLPGTWADTSRACLALLEGINRPTFGYVWDTGNLYECEEAHFLPGYEMLKPYIKNVHLKDGRIIDGAMVWQHFGEGVTDIKGQIDALLADGYDGTLTLEAKCEPHRDEDFVKSVRYLRTLL